MGPCKLGIESFANVFQHYTCVHSECIATGVSVKTSNPEWIAYNETLCAVAESCKKACAISTEFLFCVKEDFCKIANSSVKEMGRIVYLVNQESSKASAAALFPWALGATAVGFALGKLLGDIAPKSRIATALSYTAYGVGALGAAGLWHSARVHFEM